jgi:uncharacterized protein YraI
VAALLLSLLPAAIHADATATVISPDGVNLRAGPGTAFPILAVMPFGATVTVTGDPVEGGWLPVVYGGMVGYAMAEYLALSDPPPAAGGRAASPTPTPTPPPTPAATPPRAAPAPMPGAGLSLASYAVVLPPDGLNLRRGPGLTYPVLMAVPGGARLQVVGPPTPDGWYSVIYADKVGWVDGKYLRFLGPAPGITMPPAAAATPSPATGSARFIWPVDSRRVSTPFSAGHPGIDIDEFPNGGNPAWAVAAGTVSFAGGSTCCSYGLYVIIKHADGYTTLYAHLSSIEVREGQEVRQGTVIGRTGNTGFSTGAHLHFEIRKDGTPLDPLGLLQGPYTLD